MNKSEKLANQIFADYLKGGEHLVGVKLPTLNELAKQYKSSITTINKSVAMLAAKGWLKNQRGSGLYVARQASNSSVEGRNLRLGVVCQDFSGGPIPMPMMEGIMRVAQQHSGSVEISSSNWNINEEREQIQIMQDRGIDTIILAPTIIRDKSHEYLANEFLDMTIIVVDLYQPGMKRPFVIFDNLSAGREMTRYLLSLGHSNIVFITFDGSYPFRSVDDRVIGYRRALEEYDIDDSNTVVFFDITPYWRNNNMVRRKLLENNFLDTLKKVLSFSPCPTAIITPSDVYALAAIRYLRSVGITQENIAVCGFDDLPEGHVEHWPTTYRDPCRLGELAAEMAFSHMLSKDSDLPGIVIPCPLILTEQRYFENKSINSNR